MLHDDIEFAKYSSLYPFNERQKKRKQSLCEDIMFKSCIKDKCSIFFLKKIVTLRRIKLLAFSTFFLSCRPEFKVK